MLRICNTYGPKMHPNDDWIVSNFIIHAHRGEGITICERDPQTRSFCYVDYTVDAVISMMKSSCGFTGPVNAGNPDEVMIHDLAKRLIDLTDSPSKLVFSDLLGDDLRRVKP